MSQQFDKGLITLPRIKDFQLWLHKKGIGSDLDMRQWECLRVFHNSGTHVFTYNKDGVVSSPQAMRDLLNDFHQASRTLAGPHPDTERLEFLLSNPRYTIQVECMGTNGMGVFFYRVFMGDGPFGDAIGTVLHLQGGDKFLPDMATQRQIIDEVREICKQPT